VVTKFIMDRVLQKVLQQFLVQPSPIPLSKGPGTLPGTKRIGAPTINRRPTSQAQQDAMVDSQTAVLRQALYGAERSKALGFFKDYKTPEGEDFNHQRTAAIVDAVLGATTTDQIQQVLASSKLEVEKAIQALLGKTRVLTNDQRLLKDIQGKVFFKDYGPGDVKPFELEPDDLSIIEALRNHFSRLMDKKRRTVSDSVSTLDTTAYLDFITGRGEAEVFEDDHVQKGFNSLILIDQSGSMQDRWPSVARACKVLDKSMKFPFSHFDVWGFTGTIEGNVYLNRFMDPEKGYEVEKGEIWGTTPLHIAAEVAIRRLSQRPGTAQHLLIITDGLPMHSSSKGEQKDTKELIVTVSKVLGRGRKRGVNTVSLVIGEDVPDKLADFMFSKGKWVRVDDEELYPTLVGMMQGAFVSYLKRR